MSANDNVRYFWLKLPKTFFQQHQIKVLKALPNGRLYALIYLELLAESTSHNGELRYSQMLPYDVNTLASVIDEDVDNLKCAIEVLTNLELVEILDDQTIYMRELNKMIGSSTGQTIRKTKAKLEGGKNYPKITQENRDKSIDIRDKNDIYNGLSDELISALKDFEKMRVKIKAPMTDKAKKMLLNKLNEMATNDKDKIAVLDQSILNCWKGIYELKDKPKTIEHMYDEVDMP